MSDIDAIKEAYEEEKRMSDLLASQLRDKMAQYARLRALNDKLVSTSESLVELVCERFNVGTAPGDEFWRRIKAIRAALAEAREPQQPPQGLA